MIFLTAAAEEESLLEVFTELIIALGKLAVALLPLWIFLIGRLIYREIRYRKYEDTAYQTNEEPLPTTEELIRQIDNLTADYSKSYEKRYLLTKNEWHQFQKLKYFASNKGYIICPKVRLLDIIQPRKDAPKYKSLLYKIQAKHVDFLICDTNLKIKAIIEIDDNSHDMQDRKERDEFVDSVLKSVGYKVIHTRYITDETLIQIEQNSRSDQGS